MMREVIKSKIDRASITNTDINYTDSITLDETLMKALGVLEGEKVSIINITNNNRFDADVVKGIRDSGIIGINGNLVYKSKRDDTISILFYHTISERNISTHKTKIIYVDNKNKIL